MSPNSRWVSSITVYTFQCGVNNKKTQINTTAKFSLFKICFKSACGFFFLTLSKIFHVHFAISFKQSTAEKWSKKIHACIRSAGFTVTSGRVADEQVPELRQERESCRWRLRASWFPPCTSSMGRGQHGGGAVLRHCLTDSQGRRLSQRPGTTRSSSPSHRHTNNAVLQLRLWPHSHPLQIPPPSYLFSQPLLAAPNPQHGPGHRERWHAFLSQRPVQTRWVCSATASNKSEHIYDANRSVTSSFAALSTSEDWGRMSSWNSVGDSVFSEVFFIIVLSRA